MRTAINISSEEFRNTRARLFLTQAEMAAAIGITVSGVQRIERGDVVAIRASTVRKLAQMLGITPTDLEEQLSPAAA